MSTNTIRQIITNRLQFWSFTNLIETSDDPVFVFCGTFEKE